MTSSTDSVPPPPRPARSAAAADWLSGLDLGADDLATARVGPGFARHVRVSHPVDDGGTVRALPNAAEVGRLHPVALGPLVRVLRRHTATPERCRFAVWDGWGWLHDGAWQVVVSSALGEAVPAPGPAPRPSIDPSAASFEIQGRRYLIYGGPVEGALGIGLHVNAAWFVSQSPSLWWPDDRAWCVATDVDDDATIVAGPAALVDEVLADPDLPTSVAARPGGDEASGGHMTS